MLSLKQEKFCLEYAATGNAFKSYKSAGFAVTNRNSADASACNLLKKPEIAARLKELRDEVKSKKIVNIIECQEMLSEIARNKSEETADRIKAIQILLKSQGAFTTQIKFQSKPIVIAGGDKLED